MSIKQIGIYTMLWCAVLSFGCKAKTPMPTSEAQAADLHAAQNKLTEVIMFDIFSPPVASRIYAYSNLAAYEAIRTENTASISAKLNEFGTIPMTQSTINQTVAALKAYLMVARSLTFSTQYFDAFESELFAKYSGALPSDVYQKSIAYGETVANHVIAYAKKDNYGPTRGLRYTLQKQPGTWEPTPPAYADAVEPHWAKIRTLALDSAGQFEVAAMPAFASSAFQKEVTEVFKTAASLTDEQKRIAWFWDDNAFVMDVQGHSMSASKKMTPGGHWLMVAQHFCKKQNLTAAESARVYALTSIALFDGFIACWKLKYETHRIRPETVIQATLDKNWQPYLQTPPFPEYPSGHSTISAASAEVLSSIFGDSVAYTDSTEYVFGHGVGQFASFREAAEQASISRLYGGIHFRSGCTAGSDLGKKVGALVVQKLK
jgi:hypothetical protein